MIIEVRRSKIQVLRVVDKHIGDRLENLAECGLEFPQGSVLSPLLFFIFMNTIHHHIHPNTKIACYADDIANSQIKKSRPTYLSWSNRRSRTPFFKAHRTNCQQSSWKTEYSSKTKRNFFELKTSNPKKHFLHCYQTGFRICNPNLDSASISVKRKLDSVQHRAAKIIIGAVSSNNNEKAEQECGLPPLESRRNLVTIKFPNKLRSYGLDHISRRVFDKWKHSTRFKRSSTLQLDSEIRKELNLEHFSSEFLQESLIPKNPPKNTCLELELLQPCSKKDHVTLRQKGLETIRILSQDNFAKSPTPMVPQTDPSAMEVPESSSSSQMVITTNTKLTQA
ncbi:RNase H domain-containing protein [Trichonephila clavipes]|nr:RNase H domain-containing protein [Trichonephila clavipes]